MQWGVFAKITHGSSVLFPIIFNKNYAVSYNSTDTLASYYCWHLVSIAKNSFLPSAQATTGGKYPTSGYYIAIGN